MSIIGNPQTPAPETAAPAPHDVSRNGEATATRRRGVLGRVWPYLSIARPDHWFKNVFMALGVVLAYFYHPEALSLGTLLAILWAVLTTCILASSNYVLNEILDAPTDRSHPVKKHRPIPSGRVRLPLAYLEWVLLGVLGLWMASLLNWPFFFSGLFLLLMGVVYNVPPVRSKELPYIDVLSESVNNPIRLLLGWFAVVPGEVPPVSLLLSYWMIGAFFMAAKRFAEYRSLANRSVAGTYRRSFRHYDDQKLLISMVFYVTTFALFLGIFIVRYHVELILIVPLVAGFISYYLHISFKPESPVQSPEHLYRERGLMAYLVVCVVVFVGLMFVHIEALHKLFNVPSSELPALWKL
jgi:4-hydroxybenzoate polyprenyltransferase